MTLRDAIQREYHAFHEWKGKQRTEALHHADEKIRRFQSTLERVMAKPYRSWSTEDHAMFNEKRQQQLREVKDALDRQNEIEWTARLRKHGVDVSQEDKMTLSEWVKVLFDAKDAPLDSDEDDNAFGTDGPASEIIDWDAVWLDESKLTGKMSDASQVRCWETNPSFGGRIAPNKNPTFLDRYLHDIITDSMEHRNTPESDTQYRQFCIDVRISLLRKHHEQTLEKEIELVNSIMGPNVSDSAIEASVKHFIVSVEGARTELESKRRQIVQKRQTQSRARKSQSHLAYPTPNSSIDSHPRNSQPMNIRAQPKVDDFWSTSPKSYIHSPPAKEDPREAFRRQEDERRLRSFQLQAAKEQSTSSLNLLESIVDMSTGARDSSKATITIDEKISNKEKEITNIKDAINARESALARMTPAARKKAKAKQKPEIAIKDKEALSQLETELTALRAERAALSRGNTAPASVQATAPRFGKRTEKHAVIIEDSTDKEDEPEASVDMNFMDRYKEKLAAMSRPRPTAKWSSSTASSNVSSSPQNTPSGPLSSAMAWAQKSINTENRASKDFAVPTSSVADWQRRQEELAQKQEAMFRREHESSGYVRARAPSLTSAAPRVTPVIRPGSTIPSTSHNRNTHSDALRDSDLRMRQFLQGDHQVQGSTTTSGNRVPMNAFKLASRAPERWLPSEQGRASAPPIRSTSDPVKLASTKTTTETSTKLSEQQQQSVEMYKASLPV